MSFIQAFLQQTVYLGMPDESVSSSVVQLVATANHSVFSFFLSYCGMLLWKK